MSILYTYFDEECCYTVYVPGSPVDSPNESCSLRTIEMLKSLLRFPLASSSRHVPPRPSSVVTLSHGNLTVTNGLEDIGYITMVYVVILTWEQLVIIIICSN